MLLIVKEIGMYLYFTRSAPFVQLINFVYFWVISSADFKYDAPLLSQ